jgi:hypothetical protein
VKCPLFKHAPACSDCDDGYRRCYCCDSRTICRTCNGKARNRQREIEEHRRCPLCVWDRDGEFAVRPEFVSLVRAARLQQIPHSVESRVLTLVRRGLLVVPPVVLDDLRIVVAVDPERVLDAACLLAESRFDFEGCDDAGAAIALVDREDELAWLVVPVWTNEERLALYVDGELARRERSAS